MNDSQYSFRLLETDEEFVCMLVFLGLKEQLQIV